MFITDWLHCQLHKLPGAPAHFEADRLNHSQRAQRLHARKGAAHGPALTGGHPALRSPNGHHARPAGPGGLAELDRQSVRPTARSLMKAAVPARAGRCAALRGLPRPDPRGRRGPGRKWNPSFRVTLRGVFWVCGQVFPSPPVIGASACDPT
jgi:hypothetical protein